jgi:4-amino-4-deoxychorismate lyase
VKTLWLVNGKPTGVDPADRGLAYGDGLFETMAADSGRVRWLEYHLDRLEHGCGSLLLAPPSRALLRDDVAAACPLTGRAALKLILTRGPAARGYAPPEPPPTPTRILGISPWPAYPDDRYTAGIRVQTCHLRLAEGGALAGLKHLNRLEQVLAAHELRGSDAAQGLLRDASGRVIGGTSSNLFVVRRGELVTPLLTRCGVRGVMRRIVMETALALGIATSEQDLELEDIWAADELFMTNAIFGIWPVARIDARSFTVGALTRRLMRELDYGSAT